MIEKLKLAPLKPTYVWRCEACQVETTGPEHPGYMPVCVRCGAALTKTPIVQEQP